MNSMFEKLGRWIGWLLMAYIGLLVVECVAAGAAFMALSGPAEADLTGGQQMTAGSGLLAMAYATYAQVAVFIVVAVLFLRLLYKAVQQARTFAVPYSYVTPGWAVGYWFVPIINLYQPFRVVKALFASCAQQAGPDAKPAAGEQLLSGWWGMLLISGVAQRMLASTQTDFETRTGVTSYAEYSIVCNLLEIAATVLFMMVVKRLVQAMGASGDAVTIRAGGASMSQA